MVRRSRLETYIDILSTVAKGTSKPTRIMYKANLSWVSMQNLLESLIEQNLIEEINLEKTKRYEITDKGIRVLSYFRKVREALPIETRV